MGNAHSQIMPASELMKSVHAVERVEVTIIDWLRSNYLLKISVHSFAPLSLSSIYEVC